MDRIVFAVLLPAIRHDIPVSEREYGFLTGAFQAAYGLGNLVFGKCIDLLGARAGYASALALWSLAAGAHVLSRSVWHLGLWRGVLGLSEAGNFPAATKAIAEWFSPRDRAFAMGICVAGTNVAAMVGPPVFVALKAAWDWRAAFIATALAGLLVALAWGWTYRTPASRHGGEVRKGPRQPALRHCLGPKWSGSAPPGGSPWPSR